MIRRFSIAILSIIISGLKFICNMLSLVVSWASGKEMPLFGILSEGEESIKRSHYIVEKDEYKSPIKW